MQECGLVAFLLLMTTGWHVAKSHTHIQITGVDVPSEEVFFSKISDPFYAFEGFSTGYEVRLVTQPVSTVFLNFSSVDGKTTIDRPFVVFNSSNWDAFQLVYITSNQDFMLLDSPYQNMLSLQMHSTDEHYNFVNLTEVTVLYLVNNTDVAAAVLSLDSTDYPYPASIPEGRFADYNVQLSSKPLQDVTLYFFTDPYITTAVTSLLFSSAADGYSNWNVNQRLRIYALSDVEATTSTIPSSSPLRIEFQSADPKFNSVFTIFNVPIEPATSSSFLESASISWTSLVSTSRTSTIEFKLAVTFDRSILLSTLHYDPINQPGRILFPSFLEFGDRTSTDVSYFQIDNVAVDGVNISINSLAIISHMYTLNNVPVNSFEANFEQCCRSRTNSNMDTKRLWTFSINIPTISSYEISADIASSIGVAYSPKLYPINIPLYVKANSAMRFSLAAWSLTHPLSFRLGKPGDFGHAGASNPAGMTIDSISGVISWGEDHDIPYISSAGTNWNVLVLVKDLLSRNEVPLELTVRILAADKLSLQDTYYPAPKQRLFTNATRSFVVVGSTVIFNNVSITDPSVHVTVISNIEEFRGALIPTFWIPTLSQVGSKYVCFYLYSNLDPSNNLYAYPSLPECQTFSVSDEISVMTYSLYILSIAYVVHVNNRVLLLPNALLQSNSADLISGIIFEIISVKDGTSEVLSTTLPAWSPLKILQTSPHSILFYGINTKAAYEKALTSVYYSHDGIRPQEGSRDLRVYISVQGQLIQLYEISIVLTVQSIVPQLSTNVTGGSFSNEFIQDNLPVSILSNGSFSIVSRDSDVISADVLINNCFDQPKEKLEVTYIQNLKLTPPAIFTASELNSDDSLNIYFNSSVSSSIVIPKFLDDITFERVDVVLYVNHSEVSQLVITIEHQGLNVVLAARPAGLKCSANDMLGTTFSAFSVVDMTICEDGMRGFFSAPGLKFYSEYKMDGDWRISVNDLFLDHNSGVFVDWAIVLYPKVEMSAVVVSPMPSPISTSFGDKYELENNLMGRITDMQVSVQLQLSQVRGTTLTLEHPDGSQLILLSPNALCNYQPPAYILFSTVGSNFVKQDSSSSQPCSREGLSLIDYYAPTDSFDAFFNKRAVGKWRISINSTNPNNTVTILGWQLHFVLEPNIIPSFENSSCVLSLIGQDSTVNYQRIIQSIVYSNRHVFANSTQRQISIIVSNSVGPSNTLKSTISIPHLLKLMLPSIYTTNGLDENIFGRWINVSSILNEAVPLERGLQRRFSGIAILRTMDNSLTTNNGQWQFSIDNGITYESFFGSSSPEGIANGGGSEYALVLGSVSTMIRFQPKAYFHEYSSFDFLVWDQSLTQNLASGTKNVNISDYVTYPRGNAFSVLEEATTAVLKVEFLHFRGELQVVSTNTQQLDDILEDDFINIGTLISKIIMTTYLDHDKATPSGVDFQMGVAVVGFNSSNGQWEYQCPNNGDVSFKKFIGGVLENGEIFPLDPTPKKATLLAATCLIRFVPRYNFNTERFSNGLKRPIVSDELSEKPYIILKAWDMAQFGNSGNITIDTTVNNGDHGAFGINAEKAFVNVIFIDKAPKLHISNKVDNFEVLYVDGLPYPLISLVDVATLNITDEDNSFLQSAHIVLLDCHDPGYEILTFQTEANSLFMIVRESDHKFVFSSVDSVVPMWTLTATYLSDCDSSDSISIEVTNEQLPSNIPIEAFESVLKSVRYGNGAIIPSNLSRAVQFDVFDGFKYSEVETTKISFQLSDKYRPTISLTNKSFLSVMIESRNISIVPSISISDIDNELFFLTKAVIREMNSEYIPGTDVLAFNPVSICYSEAGSGSGERATVDCAVPYHLTASYNELTGTLTITGQGTPSQYEMALKTVTFDVPEEQPQNYTRQIEITVYDTIGASNSEVVDIFIKQTNAFPCYITDTTEFYQVEDSSQEAQIGNDLNLTDQDIGHFPVANATMQLVGRLGTNEEELLSAVSCCGITVRYDANSSTLTFVPTDTTAHLENFMQSMRSAMYKNTMAMPYNNTRTVVITVCDGQWCSNLNLTIYWTTVNHPPTATNMDSVINYVEGDLPIQIFPTVFFDDMDAKPNDAADYIPVDRLTTLVVILNCEVCLNIGDEIMQLQSNFVDLFPELTATNTNNVLTVSGIATVLEYTNIAQGITYRNLNGYGNDPASKLKIPGNPIKGNRTFSVYVYDGMNFSNSVSNIINLVPFSDPPTITDTSSTGNHFAFRYVENSNSVQFVVDNSTVVDVTNSNFFPWLYSLDVVITNYIDYNFENLHLLMSTLPIGLTLNSDLQTCEYICLKIEINGTNCNSMCVAGKLEVEDFYAACHLSSTQAPNPNDVLFEQNCDKSVCQAPSSSGCVYYRTAQGSLRITGRADASVYETILKSVAYSNTAVLFHVQPRIISFFVYDSQNFNLDFVTQIDMIHVNHKPVLHLWSDKITSDSYETAFTEHGLLLNIVNVAAGFSGIHIVDFDSSIMSKLVVNITNAFDGAYEGISLKTTSAALANFSDPSKYDSLLGLQSEHYPLSHVFFFTGNFTTADYVAAIANLAYLNTDSDPNETTRIISFQVFDADGGVSEVVTTMITITLVNDPPLLDKNSESLVTSLNFMEDDGPKNFSVLEDFYDAEDRPSSDKPLLRIRISQNASYGQAITIGNNIQYTPALYDYGNRSFEYTVCDKESLCSKPVTIFVSIVFKNHKPEIAAGKILLYTLVEDSVAVGIDLDKFLYDIEECHGEPFQLHSTYPSCLSNLTISLPSNQPKLTGIGGVGLNPDNNHIMVFDARLYYVGKAMVEFTVCDTMMECSVMNILINITHVNHKPNVAAAISASTAENTNLTLSIVSSDIEDSGCPINTLKFRHCIPLVVSIFTQGVNGTASIIQPNLSTESSMVLHYIPLQDFYGSDFVVVQTCDSEGACTKTSVTIIVSFVLYKPYLMLSSLTVIEEETLVQNLFGLVHDGEKIITPSNLTIITFPSNGTFFYNSTSGFIIYTGNQGFYGVDSFLFKVCNGQDSCITPKIEINVIFKNHVPKVSSITLELMNFGNGVSISFNLTQTVSDVEDYTWPHVSNWSLLFAPNHGGTTFNTTTGVVTYQPKYAYFGNDTFVYQICDQNKACSNGIVYVIVNRVNKAPLLRPSFSSPVHFNVQENDQNLIPVRDFHYDPDFENPDSQSVLRSDDLNLFITVLKLALHGKFTIFQLEGIIAYQPDYGYVGEDSLEYMVCDECSNSRNVEIGRVGPSTDIFCLQEKVIQPDPVKRGCLNVSVIIRVQSTNQPPTAIPLFLVVNGSSVNVHPLKYAFDQDDIQRDDILRQSLNLSDFRLNLQHDLDFKSVHIDSQPPHGVATLEIDDSNMSIDTYVTIRYTHNIGAPGGYFDFYYSLCDIHHACASSSITVLVPEVGPAIQSFTAYGGCTDGGSFDNVYDSNGEIKKSLIMNLNCSAPYMYTDSTISPLDYFILKFDMPTNMPPVKAVRSLISQVDLLQLLTFSMPLFRSKDDDNAIVGFWLDDSNLIIRLLNPGYPQIVLNGLSVSFNSKSAFFCQRYNISDVILVPLDRTIGVDKFCLSNLAATSLNADSTSNAVKGNFGFRLPIPTDLAYTPPTGFDFSFFGAGSVLSVVVSPPFTADQLFNIQKAGAGSMFDLVELGAGLVAELSVYNLLSDGSRSEINYTPEEYDCQFKYSFLSPALQAVCDEVVREEDEERRDVSSKGRRESFGPVRPLSSVLELTFTKCDFSTLDPSNKADFFAAIKSAYLFEGAAMAVTLNPPGSSDPTDLSLIIAISQNISSVSTSAVDNNTKTMGQSGNIKDTPLVHSIEASFNTYSLFLSIQFTSDTNILSTTFPFSQDYNINSTDLRKMITLTPDIGAHSAIWITASNLRIIIPIQSALVFNAQSISVNFNDPELLDGTSSGDPCKGVQVCGKGAITWGICNKLETSCRAYGSFSGSSISGVFPNKTTAENILLKLGASSSDTVIVTENSNLWYLFIIPAVLVVLLMWLLISSYRDKLRNAESKEISRVVRAWKTKFKDDKNEIPFGDSAEVWSRPPAMISMRNDRDPFLNTEGSSNAAEFAPRGLPSLGTRGSSSVLPLLKVENQRSVLSPALPPLASIRRSVDASSPFKLPPPPTMRRPSLDAMTNLNIVKRPSFTTVGGPVQSRGNDLLTGPPRRESLVGHIDPFAAISLKKPSIIALGNFQKSIGTVSLNNEPPGPLRPRGSIPGLFKKNENGEQSQARTLIDAQAKIGLKQEEKFERKEADLRVRLLINKTHDTQSNNETQATLIAKSFEDNMEQQESEDEKIRNQRTLDLKNRAQLERTQHPVSLNLNADTSPKTL